MVVESKKSAALVVSDKKSFSSKTSITSRKSNEGHGNGKRPKSSPALDTPIPKKSCAQTASANAKVKLKSQPKWDNLKVEKREKTKSNSTLNFESDNSSTSKTSIKKSESSSIKKSEGSTGSQSIKLSKAEAKDSEKSNANVGDVNVVKTIKPKGEAKYRDSSKGRASSRGNINSLYNKHKTTQKNVKDIDSTSSPSQSKQNSSKDPKKVTSAVKVAPKKYEKIDEKIKMLMSEDYKFLMPLYENELKKITDVWVNTIYCTLTMRTNLVKLIFQTLPQINKCQFQTEDEKLLVQIANAKNLTKSEGDSLLHFIRTLIANREKIKDQLSFILTNRKIAENFNFDWKRILHQIAEFGEMTKALQSELPDLRKKKELAEVEYRAEIEKLEYDLKTKEDEYQKLIMQLNSLKQKENMYKGNILVKVKDYKEFKTDVQSLESTEKEFAELKAQAVTENENFEKKIKDLEKVLDDKKKLLEAEQKNKEKLQLHFGEMQQQHKKLRKNFGKDFIEYMSGTGREESHSQRKEHLWSAAVKLVLRGFLLQMNKLEKDRDRLLLEVQSNDMKNLKTLADSFVKKDNFLKSIKHQVLDIQKVSKSMDAKVLPPAPVEIL